MFVPIRWLAKILSCYFGWLLSRESIQVTSIGLDCTADAGFLDDTVEHAHAPARPVAAIEFRVRVLAAAGREQSVADRI